MRKLVKLYILLGVLAALCIAALLVSRHEEKVEQIKNSGEVILEVPADTVTALSWTNEDGTFSFAKGESWTYTEDEAFPVSEKKMNELLAQFEALTAAFVIEDVEDFSQYGLDEPVCTITLTAGEDVYNLSLGDFSKMDSQRYVSFGDTCAYLLEHDPLDEFGAVLRDMILDDTVPGFDTAVNLTFSGAENYEVSRDEEKTSICESDVYFAGGKALDTENVDSYLAELQSLSLNNYVSYNVTDEELEAFGLDAPELTVTLDYETAQADAEEDEDAEPISGTFVLSLSRNPEELAAYEKAVADEEDELPSVTHYARVGESQIVYEITEDEFDALMEASFDTLRHQKLFTADFDTVTSIDVTLEGENYTFTYTPPADEDDEDADGVWTYQDEEFDIYDLRYALRALSAASFTESEPDGQEEISLTLHLDNESFPTFTLTLYRQDGESCLAAVDGAPVALVSREKAVDLIEAVRALVL